VGETHGKCKTLKICPERAELLIYVFNIAKFNPFRVDAPVFFIPWVSPTVIHILPLRGKV
jgi:hypothetical protein